LYTRVNVTCQFTTEKNFSDEQPGLIVGWGVSKVMIDKNGRFIRNHEDNLQILRVKGINMYLKNLLLFCHSLFFVLNVSFC